MDGTPSVTVYGPGQHTLASYAPRRRGGGAGPAWSCYYYEAGGGLGDGVGGAYPLVSRPLPTLDDGHYYYLQCTDGDGAITYGQLVQWDPAAPLAAIAAGDRAAELAYQDLPLPEPALRSAPPSGTDLLVGVPTWIWLDDPWHPVTASASITAVTATVTAVPVSLSVDFGDGSPPATCTGPGHPYAAGATSDCVHTFRRRSTGSGDGAFRVRATVTYEVAWTATDGRGGGLPPVARSGDLALRVGEAQAVIN